MKRPSLLGQQDTSGPIVCLRRDLLVAEDVVIHERCADGRLGVDAEYVLSSSVPSRQASMKLLTRMVYSPGSSSTLVAGHWKKAAEGALEVVVRGGHDTAVVVDDKQAWIEGGLGADGVCRISTTCVSSTVKVHWSTCLPSQVTSSVLVA